MAIGISWRTTGANGWPFIFIPKTTRRVVPRKPVISATTSMHSKPLMRPWSVSALMMLNHTRSFLTSTSCHLPSSRIQTIKPPAAYGVLKDYKLMKLASRQSFLVDPEGKIAKHYADVDPDTHTDEVLADIKTLVRGLEKHALIGGTVNARVARG